MRYLVSSILLLTFILFSENNYSQCNNGANFYPPTTYTPPTGVWASATIINWAGEVIQVNEFYSMVSLLQKNGVEVIVIDHDNGAGSTFAAVPAT